MQYIIYDIILFQGGGGDIYIPCRDFDIAHRLRV
jgi:hypothetical protein